MGNPWRLGIVGRRYVFLEGLKTIVERVQIKVALECRNLDEIWHDFPAASGLDALLIDVEERRLPGRAALQRLRAEFPMVRIALLAESCDHGEVDYALRNGLNAFILKTCRIELIVKCLELLCSRSVSSPAMLFVEPPWITPSHAVQRCR